MTLAARCALFLRELRIARRIGGGGRLGVVFFLILVTLTPFALGPDLACSRIGPAILWIAALLATLLGLDRLFQADDEDGSLDLIAMRRDAAGTGRAGQMRGALDAYRPAADHRRALFGLMLALDRRRWRASRAVAAGRNAGADLIGAIGAALTAACGAAAC